MSWLFIGFLHVMVVHVFLHVMVVHVFLHVMAGSCLLTCHGGSCLLTCHGGSCVLYHGGSKVQNGSYIVSFCFPENMYFSVQAWLFRNFGSSCQFFFGNLIRLGLNICELAGIHVS